MERNPSRLAPVVSISLQDNVFRIHIRHEGRLRFPAPPADIRR
ncbi:hypothetical protein ACFPM0_28660 [Pseudonocardia sulfidoxydans]